MSKMLISEMPISEMPISEMPISEMLVSEMPVSEMPVSEMPTSKTIDTPQEQALDSALAELDQWFGLAGVGMDGAEHSELTAQALIEDALNEDALNEEALNEEIVEAGTAVQHMPLVESAEAVETAEFEQVLAWATAQATPLADLADTTEESAVCGSETSTAVISDAEIEAEIRTVEMAVAEAAVAEAAVAEINDTEINDTEINDTEINGTELDGTEVSGIELDLAATNSVATEVEISPTAAELIEVDATLDASTDASTETSTETSTDATAMVEDLAASEVEDLAASDATVADLEEIFSDAIAQATAEALAQSLPTAENSVSVAPVNNLEEAAIAQAEPEAQAESQAESQAVEPKTIPAETVETETIPAETVVIAADEIAAAEIETETLEIETAEIKTAEIKAVETETIAVEAIEPEAEVIEPEESEAIALSHTEVSDFQALEGETIEPEAIALLTYNGPEEVLLKTAVTLHGTYDPSRVTQIVINAENKYRFTVILDAQAGIWKTELSEGFYQAGARWVRVQALDAGDRIIASQIINLIVSANPLSLGQDIKLTIQRDTLFKENPADSGSAHLSTQVSAGTSFVVKRYSYVDGHILVELDQALETVGTTGYFYASHVELRKGQQILAFETGQIPVIIPGTCQLLITQETLLKQKPADSSDLSGNQSYLLRQGEQFEITGYACIRGHFRVTLHQEIPGFGQTGYLYFEHVQLTRNTEIVKFDANALLLTILDSTVFKKRPVNSSNLSESEKATLPGGQVYGVLHYEPADDGHIAITLSEHIPNFGNTGYLNASHIQLNRGAQVVQALTSQVEINVPYFSQRDNKFSPQTTCNVTALAMVMSYYGVQPKQGQLEDELYEWCLNNYGEGSQEENVVLVRLAQAYGFNSTFATDRTWAQIRDRLKQKQPVVIGGYFTAQGHLLTLIGYSEQSYLVNDPWGDALTGYRSAYGRNLSYPKAYMEKMCSPEGDGSIWAHFIEPKIEPKA